ncbi:MAG TPA: hypothetical protein VFK05_00075 [Polyangiaceae bacterium]|nr:hypothetical protein [Polyangiaceae bacterium]
MSFVVRGLLAVACVAWPTVARAQAANTAAASEPETVRVFMRNQGAPLTFSARPERGPGVATWCISPCDARLAPGDYRLKLNGLAIDDTLKLQRPGTLRGEYESHSGMRSAAWLAANLGGIIGGVFITVGLAGGPKWAYAAGGGVLVGATAIFFITYRRDRASFSFSADPPPDVRDMPDPASMSGTRHAALERPRFGSEPRGLGLRVAF